MKPSEVLANAMQKALDNPKSTKQAAITCCLFWCLFFVNCGCVPMRFAAFAGAILTAYKLYIGFGQTDHPTINLPANSNVQQDVHTEITVTDNHGK